MHRTGMLLTFVAMTAVVATQRPAASEPAVQQPPRARPQQDDAKKPVHVTGGVFWFIPHGTTTTLGGPGTATVYELGPKNTREELATAKLQYDWDGRRHGLAATFEFKELALSPGAQLVVEYSLKANLDDGNGMRVQTELVGPAKLPRKLDATMNWGEATLRAKKGR